MKRSALRKWVWVHKWSSLACTLFLVIICISGLPLIFIHEINEAVLPSRGSATALSDDTPYASIDGLIAISRGRYPDHLVINVFVEDDEPYAFVSMAPSFEAALADPTLNHWIKFDIRTGELVNTSEQFRQDMKAALPAVISTIMEIMRRVHVDLFAKLPGQLFLGMMALLFVIALISGVVLYGPFMRKHRFGIIRDGRTRRLKWLDLHNLLGVVTLTWMAIVGLTGAINELTQPANDLWRAAVQIELGIGKHAAELPSQAGMVSAQGAFDTVRRAMPGSVVQSLVFPSPTSISPNHYTVWAKGDTPVTARMNTAALVDARTGELTKVLEMPWYLKTLQLSRPLHFGDYGGLPLKIIWALLDIVTIIVLGSGLYLWWTRRSTFPNLAEVRLAENNAESILLPQGKSAE